MSHQDTCNLRGHAHASRDMEVNHHRVVTLTPDSGEFQTGLRPCQRSQQTGKHGVEIEPRISTNGLEWFHSSRFSHSSCGHPQSGIDPILNSNLCSFVSICDSLLLFDYESVFRHLALGTVSAKCRFCPAGQITQRETGASYEPGRLAPHRFDCGRSPCHRLPLKGGVAEAEPIGEG